MSYAFRPDQLREPPRAKTLFFSQNDELTTAAFPRECLSLVWTKDDKNASQKLADQIVLAYKILRRKEFYFQAPNRLLSQLYKVIVRVAKKYPQPEQDMAVAILIWKEHLWWVTVFGGMEGYLYTDKQSVKLSPIKMDLSSVRFKNPIFRTVFFSGKMEPSSIFTFGSNEIMQRLNYRKILNILKTGKVEKEKLEKIKSKSKADLLTIVQLEKTT